MSISGIGLVTKKAKNHFEWVGGDVDSNGQVEPDELELQRYFKIMTRDPAAFFYFRHIHTRYTWAFF